MGVSHKWLNCYWVYSWRVLLSLAFALVLCSNATAHYWEDPPTNSNPKFNIYHTAYNCTGALSYVQDRIQYLTGYFEDRGCIDIQAPEPVCIGYPGEMVDSGCGAYIGQITAKVNPAVPGSCANNLYLPEGQSIAYTNFAQLCQVVEAVSQCPEFSVLPPGEVHPVVEPWVFRPKVQCYCDNGLTPGTGDNWAKCVAENSTWVNRCDEVKAECVTHCGGLDNVGFNECHLAANNEAISMPPFCSCINPPPPLDCDFTTGEGCATYDKQRQNLTALQRIEAEIARGTLHYSGIDGVLRKNDGTFTDIKTLLTQIANSPGVLSPGGGSSGGTGGNTETPETTAWTPPSPPEGNAMLTRSQQIDNEIQAKKLLLSQTSQTVKEGLLARMAITNAPTGVGGLPCWRGLSLYQGRTFDICFTDWEEHLYVIPNVIFTAALILAAFFVIRKKV